MTLAKLSEIIHSIDLPIVKHINRIHDSFSDHANLVLQAEPGAGKTTVIPLALLDLIPKTHKIIVLEPKRLAARNAAHRMAEILGEKAGQTIGYRIRNQNAVSNNTRVEVITEGILTRMLQSDPELPGVGLLIFDEFHERSLDADLGLALAIEAQQTLREDLKIVVMSATLDCDPVQALLDHCPIIHCEGRCYPVSTQYLCPTPGRDWQQALGQAIQLLINSNDLTYRQKDSLIFLPGLKEIRQADTLISKHINQHKQFVILHLYGNMPFEQQQKTLRPISNKRKIILATNIAETSVTIEGVDCVIDVGLERQSRFNPRTGFDQLITQSISAASAEQRAGRAGRLGPGYCFRLWPQSKTLAQHTSPEIVRTDLSRFALELAQWGVKNPADLCLLDQPNSGAFSQAQELLFQLKAIDSQQLITQQGKRLTRIGAHPRIAHMLVESTKLDALTLGCLIAALLEEKDILTGEYRFHPDFMHRIELLCKPGKDHHSINQHIVSRIKKQANNLFKKISGQNNKQNWTTLSLTPAPVLLAFVFPDRIAQRRETGYKMTNGSGAEVHHQHSISDPYLVCIKLTAHQGKALIQQSIGLQANEIETHFDHLIETHDRVYWDSTNHSVKSEQQRCLGALVLSSKPLKNADPAAVSKLLIQEIQRRGIQCLPWSDTLRQWQYRVLGLHQFDEYNEQFPDVSDQQLSKTLSQWLEPYILNIRKIDRINSAQLKQALENILPWSSQAKLDQLMPASIRLRSGINAKIQYQAIGKPILAIKLQQLFGEPQSPRLADGRIAVLLHLLSPARRPLQITEDLASFWADGYQQVKKEMRGRYPKHPWPDDPINAIPTGKTKKHLQ
ncbi:MAG: ATP-dependent helicase HrpB [bacterium]